MIKLKFAKYPSPSRWRVSAEDKSLRPIVGLLDGDLQTPKAAREMGQKLRDVMSGRRKPYEGAGNGSFFRVGKERTEVGADIGSDPPTVSVATADLIAAIEEWAGYLEQRLKDTGRYL